MKIAVLGANGFVGSNLVRFFKEQNTVDAVVRTCLDLLDPIAVKLFLKKNHYDVIINAAATMTDNNLLTDTRNNLGLFMNFYNNSNLFGKFINLGSGAEFNRIQDINLAREPDIFTTLPADSYGFSQNIKARLCHDKSNFFTVRIFNCFGAGEQSTRIFPRLLCTNDELEIRDDRYFDYFSIQDLCNVVDHCAKNDWKIRDVNAVYAQKLKISEALDLFCKINNLNKNFCVKSNSIINYTGNSQNLESLQIPLNGLTEGFKSYLK